LVESGIAAERLSPGPSGLQLLENSIATALGLAVLILTFGPAEVVATAGLLGAVLVLALYPGTAAVAEDVVVPQDAMSPTTDKEDRP